MGVPDMPNADDDRPRMLFLRRYHSYTGGHQKYLDYLAHVIADGRWCAQLHVTADSRRRRLEPLVPPGAERVGLPQPTDSIFVAGRDWGLLDIAGQDTTSVPVINLVQGVRHADPSQVLHRFLSRPAHRVCVSQQVADAIEATGLVNGPIHVIENGIDTDAVLAHRRARRNGKVCVVAYKRPTLGREVSRALRARGIPHSLDLSHRPRDRFLSRLARYEHAILLPEPTEGFYLTALEAMVLGVTVVMPDCVGARGFARHGQTCIIAASADELADAAAALTTDPALAERLRAGGREASLHYSLERERREFIDLLDRSLGTGDRPC